MKKTIIIVIVSILTSLSIFAQRPGSGSDLDMIRDNTLAFSDALVSGDLATIVNSYTADAKIFPSGSEILEGKELEAYWKMNSMSNTTYHKITALNIEIVGDTAYDHGYYEGRTLNEDGQESSWRGKYVVVWKKVDDNWKMQLDIWNRI